MPDALVVFADCQGEYKKIGSCYYFQVVCVCAFLLYLLYYACFIVLFGTTHLIVLSSMKLPEYLIGSASDSANSSIIDYIPILPDRG